MTLSGSGSWVLRSDSDHYVCGVNAERKILLDELVEKQGIEQKQIEIIFKNEFKSDCC